MGLGDKNGDRKKQVAKKVYFLKIEKKRDPKVTGLIH